VARIEAYVGKMRHPRSFEDGAEILRELFAAQFPKLPTSSGSAQHDAPGSADRKLVLTYEPALAETLADFDIEHREHRARP
jgi:hypothetical protein